jgi:hypothetical protein
VNFLQAQQRLARRRGAASSTLNTATATRYKEALDEAHRQILRKPGLEVLRHTTLSHASVAGTKLYHRSTHSVARINRITEATNDRRLQFRTPDWLDSVAPDAASITGTPWAWIPRGYVVAGTLTASGSVFAVSTSASDTGTVYVEGITESRAFRSTSVAMTGLTAVNVSSAITDWATITKFYLSTAAVGSISLLYGAADGPGFSTIEPGDVLARYLQFQLFPTPSSAITYTLDVLRSIPVMTNDTDEFLLPQDFEDLLLDKAEMKELRKQDDPNRYAMLREDVRRGEAALVSFITSHPDWRPQFGGHPAEFSSLGSNFPSDTVVGW